MILRAERRKDDFMTTANKLTILRVLLVPVFMVFLLMEPLWCQVAALAIFVIASATDGIDGYIARHYNQITTFGKFMDPIADKLLTTAALLVLLEKGAIGCVPVMIIMAREFIVSGVRMIAGSDGKVIAASMLGKIKTVSQMIAIVAAILLLNPVFPKETAALITNILVWIATGFTIISGIDYLVKNRSIFESK